MSWFWLNIPLGAVFFGATAGIPLWMVLRRPDAAPRPDATPLSQPVVVTVPSAGRRTRELVGATSAGRA